MYIYIHIHIHMYDRHADCKLDDEYSMFWPWHSMGPARCQVWQGPCFGVSRQDPKIWMWVKIWRTPNKDDLRWFMDGNIKLFLGVWFGWVVIHIPKCWLFCSCLEVNDRYSWPVHVSVYKYPEYNGDRMRARRITWYKHIQQFNKVGPMKWYNQSAKLDFTNRWNPNQAWHRI